MGHRDFHNPKFKQNFKAPCFKDWANFLTKAPYFKFDLAFEFDQGLKDDREFIRYLLK